MKKQFFGGVAFGVIFTITLTLVLLFGLVGKARMRLALGLDPTETRTVNSSKSDTASPSAMTSLSTKDISTKLTGLEQIIDTYYLNDIDYNTMTEYIYKGALASLGDPYSVYYTKEEFDSFNEQTTGNYCGIGVSVNENASTGAVTVVQVFKDGAGAKAGFRSGDIIYKVDGEEVTGQDLSTVVSKIKGEEGTTVNITILRGSDTFTKTLTRATVTIDTVSSEMLDNNIGYIKVNEFDEVTATQFDEAIDDLEKQGEKGLIIDLRDNPGGRYDIVCEMLDRMLPKGKLLVYTMDKYGTKEEQKSTDSDEFTKPLAVLVNGNSASASEIFSGAVKDYGIGTLVGTTTFGKGIVQQILPLNDGSAVKLTVSKYYTPSGKNIHGTGIEPDVRVELNDDAVENGQYVKEKDNQLKKAVEIIKGKM
ncbi:MAG: S41 family peptidase [Catonella sp.]|jgi:carboxyl-terminal processing protease|nr:S41 family peptidase [Catonella sp.]MDY6356749.1 S41 family peptidase [Catonella sp.]